MTKEKSEHITKPSATVTVHSPQSTVHHKCIHHKTTQWSDLADSEIEASHCPARQTQLTSH